MAGLGRMMVGDAERQREENDFYPTPDEVTRALLVAEGGLLRSHLRPGEPVWEAACGDGAMARVLEDAGFAVTGSDLVDRGYGRGGVDFLQVRREDRPSQVIVTNPPFSVSEGFIKQAKWLGVRYLALLLKATYWHAAARQPLWRTWSPSAIYPLTWRVDFTGGKNPVMDVAWFVWRSHAPGSGTSYRPLARPPAGGNLFDGEGAT